MSRHALMNHRISTVKVSERLTMMTAAKPRPNKCAESAARSSSGSAGSDGSNGRGASARISGCMSLACGPVQGRGGDCLAGIAHSLGASHGKACAHAVIIATHDRIYDRMTVE